MPDDISASGSGSASTNPESVRQPNSPVLEELTHEVSQLHGLLQDPLPGLITWCEAVAHRWHSIAGGFGIADRPCVHCGNPDRHPIHKQGPVSSSSRPPADEAPPEAKP